MVVCTRFSMQGLNSRDLDVLAQFALNGVANYLAGEKPLPHSKPKRVSQGFRKPRPR